MQIPDRALVIDGLNQALNAEEAEQTAALLTGATSKASWQAPSVHHAPHVRTAAAMNSLYLLLYPVAGSQLQRHQQSQPHEFSALTLALTKYISRLLNSVAE